MFEVWSEQTVKVVELPEQSQRVFKQEVQWRPSEGYTSEKYLHII